MKYMSREQIAALITTAREQIAEAATEAEEAWSHLLHDDLQLALDKLAASMVTMRLLVPDLEDELPGNPYDLQATVRPAWPTGEKPADEAAESLPPVV